MVTINPPLSCRIDLPSCKHTSLGYASVYAHKRWLLRMSSSVGFIIFIIIMLAALVCYALVSQTLATKREQRDRLVAALTLKARNFKFMLNGFPKGFLPPELTLMVQKSLMEIYNQLTDVESDNPTHKGELQTITQQMSDARRQTTRQTNVRLENPQQINEVKACLEELHKYIFQLEEKNRIPRESADAHRASIRELVVNITVDSYNIAGKQALDKDKPRLALHNLELALKLMQRERKSGNFDQRIAELQQQCASLSEQVAIEESEDASTADTEVNPEIDTEWAEFEEKGSDWKKKQLYE